MGQLSGNSCNIITLLPLGVDCDSLNASTPDDTNGTVTLYITGGTPPYNVTWDNGSQGTFLTNLSPGDYTATVTDYYGDFTATTTCNVGFDSFYLEEFENCENNNKIYYLADLPSIFDPGKIYSLTAQQGCWSSNGTLLYSAQTYYNTFATYNGNAFDNCEECLPDPEPTPVYPEHLCIIYKRRLEKFQPILAQITTTLGPTINGYPSWTSATPSYTIYYNTGATPTPRWEIMGWTGQGVPSYSVVTPPPVGSWTLNGVGGYLLNVVEGDCQNPHPSISLSKTDPTCGKNGNGTIIVNACCATQPYYYSLNGTTYQTSNIFSNLTDGAYTVYVKDSNDMVSTQSITLVSQSFVQNYVLNITPLTETTTGGIDSQTKTYTFKIDVSPNLQNNEIVTFDIPIDVSLSGTNALATFSVQNKETTQNNLITATTSASTFNGPVISPITSTVNLKTKPCNKVYEVTSAYTETYTGSISGSGYIVGTIVQYLKTPVVSSSQFGCPLVASIKDTVNISNVKLLNTQCSTINNISQPLSYESYRMGEITFP